MTERRLAECPKCGARGGCEKHGLSASGIDLRARGTDRRHDGGSWDIVAVRKC